MIKNNKKTMKTLVFSLGLAAMTLTANNLNAQNDGNHGLFGMGKSSANNGQGGSRGLMDVSDNTEEGISNYGIGQTVPMGSGIVILLGAGLGYMALKKKEDEQ